MTEKQLYRYFCKEARFYGGHTGNGYYGHYAIVSPITRKVVEADDSAILMDKLRKEAGLPLQEEA